MQVTKNDIFYNPKIKELALMHEIDNESMSSESTHQKLSKVHDFYFNNTDSMCSTFSNDNATKNDVVSNNPTVNVLCGICNSNSKNDNFIILSCNHLFHIKCMVESEFDDIYKFNALDKEFFTNRKCKQCNVQLQTEELLFLHGKFLSSTKNNLESHQKSIANLEAQMNKIKEELRVCYNYSHKLEQQREKSKQIVTTLTSMI